MEKILQLCEMFCCNLDTLIKGNVMAIGMFAMVGIAVSILIVSGINHKYFKKRYSTVQDFYTEEERYRFNRKFAVAIAAGVCLILFGLCLNMGLELLEDPVLEEAGGGIQLFFVAAAVWIFIYFGVQRAKYEVGEYNKKKRGEQDSGAKLTGKISGVIMLLATAILFYFGLVLDMFRIAWVVFPIGGLLCAAANVIWGDKK